jgi:hypothetical protein
VDSIQADLLLCQHKLGHSILKKLLWLIQQQVNFPASAVALQSILGKMSTLVQLLGTFHLAMTMTVIFGV